MIRTLCLSLLLAGAAQAAEAPAPERFAYGLKLEAEAQAPLYRLSVPQAVYLGVTRSDLGDLRVFNADQEPVPHLVRATAATRSQRQEAVPVFPLPAQAPEGNVQVQVRTDARGAVIDVTPEQADGASNPTVGGYLLDLSQLSLPVWELELGWSGPETGFVAQVEVTSSDDLRNWRRVGGGALAALSTGGHALRQNTLDLAGARGRYLRLSWPPELAAVSLESARVTLRETAQPPWQWRQLAGAADADGALVFDSGGHLPVERLDLGFDQPNRLLQPLLQSAASPRGPWVNRHRGLFYRLLAAETELTNPPAELALTRDRYWRLSARGESLQGVNLRLGWQPQELIFVGQGPGPYVLAYGSAGMEPPASALPALLRDLPDNPALVAQVRPVESLVLAGEEALRAPAAPLPWRQIALWAVLIAAAGALGLMAWKLARDLNRPRPE